MFKTIRGFLKNRKGATAIEYGLIAAAMALIVIVGMAAIKPGLEGTFTSLGDTLTTQNTAIDTAAGDID